MVCQARTSTVSSCTSSATAYSATMQMDGDRSIGPTMSHSAWFSEGRSLGHFLWENRWSGWWFGTFFSHSVGNIILPSDELTPSFFRGVGIPPSSEARNIWIIWDWSSEIGFENGNFTNILDLTVRHKWWSTHWKKNSRQCGKAMISSSNGVCSISILV